MYFKQFLHDDLGCSSYFLASRASREAAVIDPQCDVRPYLKLAAQRHFRIVLSIDTRLHPDHVSGNQRLAALCGAAICLHEQADVRFVCRKLRDGDELRLGQLILRIVHTPGRRPESISILATNPTRSPEPSLALTGDALFVGDIGPADVGGPEGTADEYASIQRLLTLPDYVEVFPSHFEGVYDRVGCGRPSTTIGFERRFNPVLQLAREEFLRLSDEPPARPLNMTAILATNRGEADEAWAMPRPSGSVRAVPPAKAPTWIRRHGALVLDVREPHEYAAGRLPGAMLLPQADVATRLAEIPHDRAILVVCRNGVRSARTTQFLRRTGLKRVTVLAEGIEGWLAAGHPLAV